MKKTEDLIKTLLDKIKELIPAKVSSFAVDSASNEDLTSPTSIEKSELLSQQLTREVISNNKDREEPPQNKQEKRSLRDQLEKVKKKSKDEFYASKEGSSKDDNTSSSQDLYLRNIVVIAGGSIINGFFKIYVEKTTW